MQLYYDDVTITYFFHWTKRGNDMIWYLEELVN